MPLKWVSRKVKHPCKLSDELTLNELRELVDSIQDILWVEVESRGDFWEPRKLEIASEWDTCTGEPAGIGMLKAIMDVMELNGLRPSEDGLKR